MNFVKEYFEETKRIVDLIDPAAVENMVSILSEVRALDGRIFFIGVGGGAGHASHAVNDFRKICGIEAYTPIDNVSELTARTNDDGWDTSFVNWLMNSRFDSTDALFVFSVGGGSVEKNISMNIVRSLEYAQKIGAKICAVVGRDGGYAAKVADACVLIPIVNSETVTAHTEGLQAVIWHLLVSHPRLRKFEMKWESIR